MIPIQIKLIIGVCLIGLAGYIGWDAKSVLDQRNSLQQVHKQEVANSVQDVQNRTVEASSATAVIKTVIQTQTKYQIVKQEIIKYVASNPAHCQLNPDWVRQYNAAVAGSNSSSSTTVSHGTDASTATSN